VPPGGTFEKTPYTRKKMTAPAKKNLNEQKKVDTYAKVMETAQRLFQEYSFDSVTLKMICKESDISKRTFFRYFKDKQSLIFPHREERLAHFVKFLKEHQKIDNPFDALRAATVLFGARYKKNRQHFLTQQQTILSSQALMAREQEIDKDWEHEIAKAFSARSGTDPTNDLWARVLAGAIMGVIRSTMTYWFERKCKDDLSQLGLDALDYLERGFPHINKLGK